WTYFSVLQFHFEQCFYATIVTDSPVNLEGINSAYDDYNSDLPYPYQSWNIFFSSNRKSKGVHFDIIHRSLFLSYHEKDDVLDVHFGNPGDLTTYETMLFDLINSTDDQLGPLSFFGPEEYSYFFYADNQNGDFDIWFTHHLKSDFGTYQAKEVLNGPDSLMVINSDMDDLYPSFMGDLSHLFFCSNRENDHFDIYSIQLPETEELHGFITGNESGESELNTVLSSNFNDKCPYIYEDIMVFASDREGGQGGFDLYYSLQENGAWSPPVNFGPKINTEYDEYRPIFFCFFGYEFQNLMIFSSDRPGGLGGFDLYMVKADEKIKH
ncbi:MAG: PD40 domain-containing protein, partial [Bacteroidales bacterium]|nr:PD40 domain-containing protein [Bacteroidales bacterium]